ncbi:MAG: S-adenosylmethionine decarboxylase proenzyme [Candidatus Delongbacteria bacterium]|nr:S-adenosylmethionine decarboxylase proenzyme [Candidatus Delongbacteria bacterium]MBN2836510.1 S-adenosylmethionine decarboxylase proenzyme [Candidatus Delongbacteria bacterium]
MKALGNHVLVEYYGCRSTALKDVKLIETELQKAAVLAGATVVGANFHEFSPFGVSGVVIIAESHLSIHTWPEYGYAAVDLFTCGETVDPWVAFQHIKEILDAKHTSTIEMKRGQLHDIEGELKHKIC